MLCASCHSIAFLLHLQIEQKQRVYILPFALLNTVYYIFIQQQFMKYI